MKKAVAAVLTVFLAVILFGCGNNSFPLVYEWGTSREKVKTQETVKYNEKDSLECKVVDRPYLYFDRVSRNSSWNYVYFFSEDDVLCRFLYIMEGNKNEYDTIINELTVSYGEPQSFEDTWKYNNLWEKGDTVLVVSSDSHDNIRFDYYSADYYNGSK